MNSLRTARAEDREEIRRIDLATRSPRVTPGPPPDGERDLLEDLGAANVIVAEAGEGLAGYLILGGNVGARRLYESRGFEIEGPCAAHSSSKASTSTTTSWPST